MGKTLVSINLGNFGSTGNIMRGISKLADEAGYQTYQAYPSNPNNQKPCANDIVLSSYLSYRISRKLSFMTGYNGCFAIVSTLRFLRKLDAIKPDILHLHNLHNSYINLPMLFGYIKKHNIRTVWTLHDCWAFTGQCPHFTMAKCGRWKEGCHDCPQYMKYPASRVDKTKVMWKKKRKWFTGVKNLTIITPSNWLADLVRISFLGQYPVKVIHNGIDLNVFKPCHSDLRDRLLRGGNYLIIGVAFDWGKGKGLDVFNLLAQRLPLEYKILLVGTNDEIDSTIDKRIISIHRTSSREELAMYYSAADVFVNPTREEVLGMVNIEALACGVPVVTFDTGGCKECTDENNGIVVPCDDVDILIEAIENMCGVGSSKFLSCIECAKRFNENDKYIEYLGVYDG